MRDFAHVPRKKSADKTDGLPRKLTQERVSLKVLADYVGLAPATISLVMNRSAVADSIPRETQDRIFEAARQLNYRPNFYARSLRTQRSFTIGVMVPEVSEGYAALVMSGIEEHLLNEGYFYFVASHRHRADLIDEYPVQFLVTGTSIPSGGGRVLRVGQDPTRLDRRGHALVVRLEKPSFLPVSPRFKRSRVPRRAASPLASSYEPMHTTTPPP